jgi:ribosomal protein S18 acetylase RimI-like enzyme
MELTRETAHYIVRFHHYLMTDVERRAQSHLFATMKATSGRSDLAAQREARNHRVSSRVLSDDRDVLALAADGFEAFEVRTAKRILRDSSEGVILNCCPKCGQLAKTPTARQCRFCRHDWHDAKTVMYRQARNSDIPAMAEIRAADWGDQEYWKSRIHQYLTHQLHPKEALPPRIAFVAIEQDGVVGLIAGHLTTRFSCDGELEWISVRPEYRRHGIGSHLIRHLSAWFGTQGAQRVCVDVEPSNRAARRFYELHGAKDLKPHWMVWEDISLSSRCAGRPMAGPTLT